MVAAVTALGASSASATDNSKQCGQVQIVHSEDGGATWSSNGQIMGDEPVKVSVKLQGSVPRGCEYPVSLALYKTQGPSWESSGKQKFLGFQSVNLSSDKKKATLSVAQFMTNSTCYGQIDLYGNGREYNGQNGNPLPHYPNVTTPENLITAWNGAHQCGGNGGGTGPTSPYSPSAPSSPSSPSAPYSPSAPSSPSGTPSGPASPTTSAPPSGSPMPSSSASAPAGGPAPSGSPVVQPVSSTPTGNLAETGSNSSQTTAFAAGGAVLVALGAGAVFFTRRRNRTNAG
jgi:LPXTG-motif cell wall-anchored protein